MPALSHVTKVYATKHARVTPMTADPASGTATYGTSIRVPGVKTVVLTGAVSNKELHGDHQLLDVDSFLQSLSVKFSHAKENMDMRAAIVGGTVTDSGTTPNQIARWRLLGTDSLF